MKSLMRAVSLCCVTALCAACWHATIVTGKPESQTVVEKQWASSFIEGLVPPDVMDVSKDCPDGVAKVETQHSFLNELVSGITFGIYTPMDIKVTCSGSGGHASADYTVPENGTPAERQAVINAAANAAITSGNPVTVKF
jgi:Bor protein